MILTTIIMLVDWASAFFPLLSLILSSSLGGTMFAISVTTDCRYSGSCLMVAITSRSGVWPPLDRAAQKWRRSPFAYVGDSPQP